MRTRLGFFIGFGAGYVLGAKAGTERYDQIQRLYQNLKSSPTVQRATGRAASAASSGISQAKGAASEGASKVAEAVRDRRSGSEHPTNLSVAPPPAH